MSVTVQCTVVMPTGKLAGASLLTLATPQLSLVPGTPRFSPVMLHRPGAALVVMLAGHVMLGGWLSTTTMVCGQVLLLPPASVTVQVTIVVPTGKLAGASLVTLP